MNPDLAEICGIHAGDGYLRLRERNKGEIDISGNIEEKEYYDRHVVYLFNRTFSLNLKGRFFTRGTYGFVIYKKEIRDIFIKLGFPSGKKSKVVRVPKAILDSKNKEFYSSFLRGLFDTDGYLGFRKFYGNSYSKFKREKHNYPYINIVTISENLVKDIRFMLTILKIDHFVYNYQPKNPRDNLKYYIIVNGEKRLNLWMKIIGSKNPVKFSRYLIWRKFGFCPTNTTFQQRKKILKGKLNIYDIGS